MGNIRKDKITIVRREGHYEAIEGQTFEEACSYLGSSFVGEAGIEAPVEARLLDLVSEVGEPAREALEATAYGRAPFRSPDGWSGELGDAFFSLICLANSTGVDLEAALDKYRQRLALGDDSGG
jgi:NTP pyrophosphatase (non-canonical NTP hydrolase)